MNIENIEKLFKEAMPNVDFCSLRYEEEHGDNLTVLQDNPLPPQMEIKKGAMITIHHDGGMGYAATSDMSLSGLKKAIKQASDWARSTKNNSIVNFSKLEMPHPVGEYSSEEQTPWASVGFKEKFQRMLDISKQLKTHDQIVSWHVSLYNIKKHVLYLTNQGGKVYQKYNILVPDMGVAAYDGNETIHRSLRHSHGFQSGLESLDHINFDSMAPVLAEEATLLLKAPTCPSETMDLLLAPDQMMLQIHESIGHPLELDRILGDERNYAGTSFVTQDMFGHYQYGSKLLNVSFDPSVQGEMATYAFDDEGTKAEKTLLIEAGILKKPLGGHISQKRSGMEGVANSRADSWCRPAMDRMANLNIEPGESSMADMISSVENGIYMKTNSSWSIDDSRNKFQFGCEWGQLIKNGELKGLVKKPNYRGRSESFWKNLKMVGNHDTFEVLGTPFCGKGEPNQVVRVGHASPACLFSNVSVFGGE